MGYVYGGLLLLRIFFGLRPSGEDKTSNRVALLAPAAFTGVGLSLLLAALYGYGSLAETVPAMPIAGPAPNWQELAPALAEFNEIEKGKFFAVYQRNKTAAVVPSALFRTRRRMINGPGGSALDSAPPPGRDTL
jgi:hypothetical protein